MNEPSQTCRMCGETKPADAFTKAAKTGKRYNFCRACNLEKAKKWRAANPARARELAKASRDRRTKPERERAAALQKAWYEEHREELLIAAKAKSAEDKLRKLWRVKEHVHGVSQARYLRLLELQGGVCALCRSDDPGRGYLFSIDHDHKCCPVVPGKQTRRCGSCVRGLLCHRCNLALGLFKDDAELLQRASDYVRNSPRV